jgi:hypothetical protein
VIERHTTDGHSEPILGIRLNLWIATEVRERESAMDRRGLTIRNGGSLEKRLKL